MEQSPKQSPAETEPVYRFLKIGEIVEDGDETPTDNCDAWVSVNRWTVGHPVTVVYKTIRRRVFPPASLQAEVSELRAKLAEARAAAFEEAAQIADAEYQRHNTGSSYDIHPVRQAAADIRDAIRSSAVKGAGE